MKGKFGKIGLLCVAVLLALVAVGVGLAHWQQSLTIGGTVNTGSWGSGETPGFWENWDRHNTYTEDEIVGFLTAIDGTSDWLDGILTIDDMVAVFAAGVAEDATMEAKFLRQYLATRLNAAAGGLYLDTVHDFSSYDPSTGDYPYGYLALSGQGTLEEIIDAIEGKEGTSPSPAEFEIMKDICDFLNSQET